MDEKELLAEVEGLKRRRAQLIKCAFHIIFRPADYDFIMGPWQRQGLYFALDTYNMMAERLHAYPHGTKLTCLDVGAGPGYGTNLIATLFGSPDEALQLEWSAIELSSQ
jgi:hypothetical protein